MAASVLQRCLTAAVKVKRINPTFTARRCLLSAAYTDATLWEAQEKDPQNLALLANSMDKTYDRKFPVSSLTVSRFVDNISSREEIDQAEYYLYKFRHSPNCWYLRDWTVHSWIRQCLKYDARDKALHTLKNKVQYGIFPDNFSFNLLLDSYIKDEDFKSACAVVEEVMLQEAFDLRTTQVLSLYALSSHLATQPQLTVSEERSLGAALLIAGMKLEDTTLGLSAQLLGNALIGKMEMLQGIHAVFRDLPLLWTRGYLGRALAVMERVVAAPDLRLSKDMLDHVDGLIQDLSPTLDSDSSGGDSSGGEEEEEKKEEEAAKLDENDMEETAKLPHYTSRFKELLGQLEAQGKVEPSSLRTLASGLARSSLAGAEGPDLEQYRSRVQAWEAERVQLVQREKETKEVVQRERAQRLAIRAARERQRDVSTQGQRDRPTQGQGKAYGRHVRH